MIDQELVSRLVSRRRERDPLAKLTDRERQVLALMAQGLTSAALSEELFVSAKTVEGYIRNVFTKFGLQPGEREHRRVLAVLQFLRQVAPTTDTSRMRHSVVGPTAGRTVAA